MCWFIVVHHQIYDVELSGDEDDLEDGVPPILRRVGPKQIEVPRDVNGEVEEL
jgi:hypothetical protein